MDKFCEEFCADLRQLGYSELEIIDVILNYIDNYSIELQIKKDKIIEKIKNDLYKEI